MVRSWPLRTSGQPTRQGAHEGICASDVGGLPAPTCIYGGLLRPLGMRIRRSRPQLDLSSVGRSGPTLEALVYEVADETEAAALRIVPA
jgi:hypothetical protein